MHKKPKVVVIAYYGINLGDDLFLKILFERYKNVEWYLVGASEEYYSIFDNHEVQMMSKKDFILNFYKFQGLVNIGGSIFIQTKRWYGYFLKRIFYTLPLKLLNKKVFILGSNFGPYKSSSFINSYKTYFKFIDDICFREQYSYKLFEYLGNVRFAPDLVFGLNGTTGKTFTSNKKKNTIGLSIMNLTDREELSSYNSDYLLKMAEIVTYSVEKGYKVKLFSFCETEGDEIAITSIMETLDEKIASNVNKVFYMGNINDFLHEFSKMEYFISLRFHSFVLSQVFEQPVYPIIYSKKTYNVLQDTGIKEYIDLKNIKNLDVENLFTKIKNNRIDIKSISDSSNEHFKRLDLHLERDT